MEQTVHVLVVETEFIRFLKQLFKVAYHYVVISTIGYEAHLFIVVCNTVFFTNNVYLCVCRNEKTVF